MFDASAPHHSVLLPTLTVHWFRMQWVVGEREPFVFGGTGTKRRNQPPQRPSCLPILAPGMIESTEASIGMWNEVDVEERSRLSGTNMCQAIQGVYKWIILLYRHIGGSLSTVEWECFRQ